MVDTSKTDHILSVAGNIWKAAPPSVYWDMEINGVEFEDAVKNWERDNLGDVIDTDDYFEYEYPDPFNPHEEIPGVSPEEARNLDSIIDGGERTMEDIFGGYTGDPIPPVDLPEPEVDEVEGNDWLDNIINMAKVALPVLLGTATGNPLLAASGGDLAAHMASGIGTEEVPPSMDEQQRIEATNQTFDELLVADPSENYGGTIGEIRSGLAYLRVSPEELVNWVDSPGWSQKILQSGFR